ncbi:MAG: NADH-quinone oxidoreductase subunit N [Pseudomonadales bacterium]|nr:NADH-quinone oxidoreductase subunit N [Pseudomonadales bacterium]
MSNDVILDLMQIILLTLGTVVVMITAAFKRDHGLVNALTLVSLSAALLVFVFIAPVLPQQATILLMIDGYSLFFSTLIIIGALVVTTLAYPYFEKHNQQNEEFYILLMIGTLGAVILAASNHFVSFFLGMEILSISLYAMIAYPIHKQDAAKFPLEASVKYLILSGLSSASILFGVALLYAQSGTLSFDAIPAAVAALELDADPVFIVGLMMIMAGVAFKLSLVPFHIWTPDVYEGAPVPVTAFIATLSKAAMLAVSLRLIIAAKAFQFEQVTIVLSLLAAASMIVGNLLAVQQNNVKRILAYSSIAHLGYLLVVIITAAVLPDSLSVEAMTYYIAAYFLTSLAGFAVISALSNAGRELDDISDYQGLFWRNPWLAAVMTVVLLSLAGIPLTVGFIGKFYIFSVGVEGNLWFLLSLLIIGSGIGLYYYLRLVYAMLLSPADMLKPEADAAKASLPAGIHLVLASLTALILYLGVYPAPLIATLQSLASGF